jgi:S-formylglutathione hydrolase FrmB
VADWFDDQGAGREGFLSEAAFSLAAFINKHVEPFGPAWLNRIEDEALKAVSAVAVGGRAARASRGHEERPDFELAAASYGGQGLSLAPKEEETAETSPAPAPAPAEETPEPPPAQAEETPEPPPAQAEETPEPPPAQAEETPTPAPAQAEETPTPAPEYNPSKVLLLGDSMMLEGFGPPLQRKLKKFEGLTVRRDGRYGAGLCRLDVFDWLKYFDEMLDKYEPELVIITLGANDTQDILNAGGKKRVHVASDEWNEIYGQRVRDLLSRAAARNVRVFWAGLPIMGREPYGARAANINRVVEKACAESSNGRFWDGWLAVADAEGKYAAFAVDAQGRHVRIRAKDSIHLTEKGGEIMAEKFLSETGSWASYEQKSPGPEEESQIGRETPPAPGAAEAPDAGHDAAGEAAPSSAPAANLSEKTLFSKARGQATSYLVVRPEPSPQSPGPFPTIFLLHGAWDRPEAWLSHLGEKTLEELAALHQAVIVMPDGEAFGWYVDGPEAAIETYIMRELLPHILATEPAEPGRLAISGLSMGGHGALTLALKHPGTFKAVSSISGVLDLVAHSGETKLDLSLKLREVLGPPDLNERGWRDNSARQLTEANPRALDGVAVIVAVGRDDRLTLAENRAYADLLDKLEIEHVYNEDEGGHDWRYWAGRIPEHLAFLAEELRKK